MRIEQLVFQGIFGLKSPARVSPEDDVSRVSLPDGVTPDDTHVLLYNLLYPDRRTPEHRDLLDQAREPKLAVFLRSGGTRFRVARRRTQDSLRLQIDDGGNFKTVASGPKEVAEALQNRLGRPAAEEFHILNLWQFETLPDPARPELDMEALDYEAHELIEEYREALAIEDLEEEIAKVDAEVENLKAEWGQQFEAVEKLDKAQVKLEELEMSEVSAEDLEMVRSKDDRIQGYEEELERLHEDREREREAVERLEPAPPWKSVWLWLGALIGVGALASGIIFRHELRWLVLLDAFGFGMVVWVLLKYLTDLERTTIHKVRVDSIRRRISELRQEMVSFRERIDHLLVHANAEDELELLERSRRARRLREIVGELEERVGGLRGDEAFAEARKRYESAREQLEDLQEQRDELPPYGADPGHLEMELESMGIEPEAVLADEEDEQDEGEASGPNGDEDPFELLRELAIDLDLWIGDGLRDGPLGVWRKISRHLLGDAFDDVRLTPAGEIRFGDMTADQIGMWRRTRRSEVRAAASALALAMHLARYKSEHRCETVWISDPRNAFASELAGKFDAVFKSSASRSHFALLE